VTVIAVRAHDCHIHTPPTPRRAPRGGPPDRMGRPSGSAASSDPSGLHKPAETGRDRGPLGSRVEMIMVLQAAAAPPRTPERAPADEANSGIHLVIRGQSRDPPDRPGSIPGHQMAGIRASGS